VIHSTIFQYILIDGCYSIVKNYLTALYVLFCLLVLTACVSTPAVVSQETMAMFAKPAITPKHLVTGDLIEVRFYRNVELKDAPYLISSGDVLRVDVLDHPKLSRDKVLVLPDGHISLPHASRLSAAGRSIQELLTDLDKIYRKNKIVDPVITVSVEHTESRVETLLQEISSKGRSSIEIIIDRNKTINLPFIKPISASQTFADIQTLIIDSYQREFGGALEVTVNKRSQLSPVVYVIGEVVKPGEVPYVGQLNPVTAIASVGGFRTSANKNDVRLLRINDAGTLSQISLDIEASIKGESENIGVQLQLMPMDIVYIPPSGVASANLAMEQYVRRMLPFTMGIGFSYELNNAR